MKEIYFSIIIPVFNRVQYTKDCIDALYKTTPLSLFELIIVNNGSTDGTKEYLDHISHQFNNIKVIHNDKNCGFAKACNQGADLAEGSYLIFLNNNTLPLKGWLDALIEVAEKEDKVGVIGSKLLFPDNTIQHAGMGYSDKPLPISPYIFHYRKPANYPEANIMRECPIVSKDCMFTPRWLFKELNGFDESFFNGYEDVDYCFRIREMGYRVIYTPKSVLYYFESVTEPKHKYVLENERRLLEKWLDKLRPEYVPKVSVIILNYNNWKDTIECLESIYKNIVHGRFQIILVDNGSKQEDVCKLRDWINKNGIRKKGFSFNKELIFLPSSENLGFAGGNNIGIRRAIEEGADYIWILNNDIVVDKDALWSSVILNEVYSKLYKKKKIGIISSKIYCYKDRDKVQFDGKNPNYKGKKDEKEKNPCAIDFAPGCALLVRKEVFEEIGLLNEEYFLYYEDNDFCKRARDAEWIILYNPDSKVYHKGGASIGQWLGSSLSAYYATRNLLYYYGKEDLLRCFKFLENVYWKELKKTPDCIKGFVEGVKDFIIGKKGKVDLSNLDVKKWIDWPDLRLKEFAERFVHDINKLSLIKFLSFAQSLLFKRCAKRLSNKEKAILNYKQGEEAFAKGDINKAVELFEEAILLDPLFALAYSNLSAVYWHIGEKMKALEYISKAMKISPDNPDIMWNCAQIMMGLGFIDEANEVYHNYGLIEQKRAIEKQQDELLKKMYNPDIEKLIIFLTPGEDIVNGGILSISSIFKESTRLKDIHGSEVIMCTIPGDPVLLKYTKFNNENYIFRFSQVISYFYNLKELIIHIPEYAISKFLYVLTNSYLPRLRKINKVHFNIMLQNIQLLPDRYKLCINKLKEMGKVTCTTAHDQYSTLDMREKLGIPLHKLSTYVSPELYNKRDYKDKEDLMIISPDPHPQKIQVLNTIHNRLPYIKIQVIKDMSYEEYKNLISKAKWSLTFGEGLDGYFIETIFSGGISFAVDNQDFFTDDFRSLRTVYKDYNSLIKNICFDIQYLDNEQEYNKYHEKQFKICSSYYNYTKYIENLKMFYKENYTYK